MKSLFFLIVLISWCMAGFCQKSLISYDDIKYLLHNNINMSDTFLVAKGYVIVKKDNNNKTRKYSLTFQGARIIISL